MGVAVFHGMAHLLMRHPYQTVTHVPGLFCYQLTRSVPPLGLTTCCSGRGDSGGLVLGGPGTSLW
jgi:hypothetical protein